MFKRVVFLHPDLGIGGAERLVVDAAVAYAEAGYDIKFITNHHDRARCFEETREPGMNILVVGNKFPRSFFGRFLALCAYIRLLIGALYLLFTCNNKTDLIFVDQISIVLPLLHWFGFKTLFFGHFPDKLLTSRDSLFKRIYRYPLDYFEERSLRFCDKFVVNSKFTAGVFRQAFPSLVDIDLEVLYPVTNPTSLKLPTAVLSSDDGTGICGDRTLCRKALPAGTIPISATFVFVSINRYERKKNLRLALLAMGHLFANWDELVDSEKPNLSRPTIVHLVLAGGYDARLQENVDYYEELVNLAEELEVSDHVTFIRSCPSEVKTLLISSSDAVLYTPDNEHFGIVPIEAMYLSRPVIALCSGGPKETVLDGSTGYLCPVDSVSRLPELMANHMARFVNDPSLGSRMGQLAHRRVMDKFSFGTFKHKLCELVKNIDRDADTLSGTT